jgi:uncharacterized protein YhbP (UPF0306 family)
MTDDMKKEVVSYLSRHLYANLATISAEDPNQPHASSIAYVNDGLNLYFVTSLQTEKFRNISANPKIALTVDEDEADWTKITGIQLEGEAEVLSSDRIAEIAGPFLEKFPFARTLPQNSESRFIKITPKKIWVLDYRKGFGHRDYMDIHEEAFSGIR